MLVAPSEPKTIKLLGKVSSVPERLGADILFPARGGLVGIQRKEISDLIASVQDGRLQREIGQMKQLGQAVLIVEGRLRWSTDGLLLKDYGIPWSRATHRNLLYSVQAQGVWVESTDDANDTVGACLNLMEYMKKTSHKGLLKRPGPVSPWGKATNREWASHLLQSFDGVGPELAERIVEHFGGRAPLTWTCTAEALVEVKGVGVKKAKTMTEALV